MNSKIKFNVEKGKVLKSINMNNNSVNIITNESDALSGKSLIAVARANRIYDTIDCLYLETLIHNNKKVLTTSRFHTVH